MKKIFIITLALVIVVMAGQNLIVKTSSGSKSATHIPNFKDTTAPINLNYEPNAFLLTAYTSVLSAGSTTLYIQGNIGGEWSTFQIDTSHSALAYERTKLRTSDSTNCPFNIIRVCRRSSGSFTIHQLLSTY